MMCRSWAPTSGPLKISEIDADGVPVTDTGSATTSRRWRQRDGAGFGGLLPYRDRGPVSQRRPSVRSPGRWPSRQTFCVQERGPTFAQAPRRGPLGGCVQWWQGASGEWLVYGHYGDCKNMLSALRDSDAVSTSTGPTSPAVPAPLSAAGQRASRHRHRDLRDHRSARGAGHRYRVPGSSSRERWEPPRPRSADGQPAGAIPRSPSSTRTRRSRRSTPPRWPTALRRRPMRRCGTCCSSARHDRERPPARCCGSRGRRDPHHRTSLVASIPHDSQTQRSCRSASIARLASSTSASLTAGC